MCALGTGVQTFALPIFEGSVLPTWQHLWFVVYLFVYTLLAVLLLLLVPEAARARITDGAARLLGGWGILVLPLAAWIAILFAFPGYRETHALFDDGPNSLPYLVPFFPGWLDRTSFVSGKGLSVLVTLGGVRFIK